MNLEKKITENDFEIVMNKNSEMLGSFISASRQKMEIQKFLFSKPRVEVVYLSKYSKITVND